MKEKLRGNTIRLPFLLAATLLFMVMCFTSSAFAYDQPSGTGTLEDPYQIGTLDELYWFVDYVNASTLTDDEKLNAHNAVLTADIVVNNGVMSEETNSSRVAHWTSIKNYNAVFDGQGHTISGIYFDDYYTDTYSGTGFISNTKSESAEIKNLGIINSYFTSYNTYLGAICGYSYGTIENCYNNSTVYGIEREGTPSPRAGHVGGICGYSENSIINCYNMGNVSNSVGTYAAGICSHYMGTEIINCYNTGNISAKRCAAGIYAYRNSAQINNVEYCYNTGNITVEGDSVYKTQAGGISATLSYTTIRYCYNLGDIESNSSKSDARAGGILCRGDFAPNATIENCYNQGYISAKSSDGAAYAGGIVSDLYTSVVIENCYNYSGLLASGTTARAAGHIAGNDDSGTVINCYSREGSTVSGVNGTPIAVEAFSNGEVTYLLNESVSGATTWYQNIDLGEADVLPTLDNSHYRVYYDAATDTYSNSTDVMSGICGGGKYGVNLLYLLNTSTQTLEITGSGEMADYTEDTAAPWAEYSTYIKYIIVSESAQLDDHAFDGCDGIEVVYCYESSPADEYFSGNSSVTRKYVVDESTLRVADLDTEARTFTVAVNTDEFGGTGAKYLDEVKVIVNNNDEDMGVTNYSDDETDSKYINFDVSCTEGTEEIVEIRGEVIAKNFPDDEGLLYYVTDIYDLVTGA